MQKRNAIICGWVASISVTILIPIWVNASLSGSESALQFISLAFVSAISAALTGIVESKNEKPDVSAIGVAAILNLFGVGLAVYQLLKDEDSH